MRAEARVELAAPVAGAAAGNRSGEEIYKATCAACHDAGVANAPKLGDKAAGVRAQGVAWGFHTAEEVALAGADHVAMTFDELSEALDRFGAPA